MSQDNLSIHPSWLAPILKEIATVVVGGTPNTTIEKYWGGDVPWMTSGDVHLYRIIDVPRRISNLGLKASNATLVDPPAVAVALAGQGRTRGTVALIQASICTNQSVALITPRSSTLNSSYLFHNLCFRYDELRSRSAGGGRAGLSKGILEQIPIPLPTIDEQRDISRVLDIIDKCIEQSEAIIAKQQRIKTALMQDLLTRGIDEHGNIRSEKTHAFKNSPLGRIPAEWEIEPCSQLCTDIVVGIVVRPAQYYRPEGVPILRSANVKENFIDLSDLVFMSKEANAAMRNSQLREGDLVTVRTGYPGTTAMIPKELDGANCIDVVISRPNRNMIRPQFLSLWINSIHGKRQVLEGQGGLAQQHFNVGAMRKLLVRVPSLAEQDEIAAILSRQLSVIDKAIASHEKLRRKKTALMQDLLTGKVRVTPLLGSET